MKSGKRKSISISLILLAVVLLCYAIFIEPVSIKVTHLQLPALAENKIVHISDLHYCGNSGYIDRVIQMINVQKPDIVCFTGDFITDKLYLSEVLDKLDGLCCPVVAVPGNHEKWQQVDLKFVDTRLRVNGGRLLVNESYQNGSLVIIGLEDPSGKMPPFPEHAVNKVLMCHYPVVVDFLSGEENKFDIILSGHTHGGQVRLPGVGALLLPYNTGRYDLGLFDTPCGPLYVTSGVGWLKKIRFYCRPEMVVIN